ncbi:MAG: hypothetical protein J5938_00625, partial [Clostridia bacterium]|nr:hypothetical protein [Clostridia bacterium]
PQTEPPTQEPATQPPQTEPPTQEPATEPPQTTEELQTEPVTEEIPAVEPTYEVIYLSGDRSHRYYEIKAQRGQNGQLMDFLVRIPAWDNSALRPDMEAQLEKINRFAASKPEVNWYVFPVTCFEDTALCDEILPSESKRELFVEFRNRLNPGIQYDCVEIKTIEDKYNKYFRTDHHWNVYGYTEAYRKITAMMQKNYSDIKLYNPQIRTFDQVEFYGSNALAVSSYNLSDTFAVAVYPLADHTVVREKHVPYGGTETLKESLARYESGNYEKSKSYSHYIQFQMICRKIEYPENKTGRNLLIIGDSYSPPLQEVLASYFDTTYVRYVDSNSGLDPIAYEYLIEKYNITDVLLLEMSDRVVYDYYGDSLKGLT